MSQHGKSSKKPQGPKPPSLQEKLANAQAKRDFWKQAAQSPQRDPQGAAAALDLAKSWDAAAQGYRKALEQPQAESDPYLDSLLGPAQPPAAKQEQPLVPPGNEAAQPQIPSQSTPSPSSTETSTTQEGSANLSPE